MSQIQDDAVAVAIKDAKKFALDEFLVVLIPALEAAVKKTATPLDDVALAALEQPLKDEIQKLLAQ